MTEVLPLLLEPEQLAALLPLADNIVVLEQASLEQFQQGHIPNSLWLDFKLLQCSGNCSPGLIPEAKHLSALFGSLGINKDTHIVCSDGEGGGWAGRLIWVLDSIGHTHYSLLNGGLVAWKHANLPLSTEVITPAPSHYPIAQIKTEPTITKDDLVTKLGDSHFVIWDARSPAEYRGKKVLAARAGHIPGAINFEWTQAMDQTRGLRLKDLNELRSTLKQLGIEAGQEIVTHCQTHHRSGLTYVIGKLLGFNIKGYAGSWSEWGNDPHTPIQLP
ncbi:MAG: rhodanese-like domain-containing protein [Venatoribacter sp.]